MNFLKSAEMNGFLSNLFVLFNNIFNLIIKNVSYQKVLSENQTFHLPYFKKTVLMPLLVLLIVFLFMGSVSALDNSTYSGTSGNITNQSSNFQKYVDNSSLIVLEAGTYYLKNINITHDIKIEARKKGSVDIVGDGKEPLFNIKSGNLTLSGLSMQNYSTALNVTGGTLNLLNSRIMDVKIAVLINSTGDSLNHVFYNNLIYSDIDLNTIGILLISGENFCIGNILFENNIFDVYGDGIVSNSKSILKNISFINNTFRGERSKDLISFNSSSIESITIKNNNFLSGLTVLNFISSGQISKVLIENNTFTACSNVINFSSLLSDKSKGLSDIKISNNEMDCSNLPITLYTNISSIENIVLESNSIVTGKESNGTTVGVDITSNFIGKNILIKNNRFEAKTGGYHSDLILLSFDNINYLDNISSNFSIVENNFSSFDLFNIFGHIDFVNVSKNILDSPDPYKPYIGGNVSNIYYTENIGNVASSTIFENVNNLYFKNNVNSILKIYGVSNNIFVENNSILGVDRDLALYGTLTNLTIKNNTFGVIFIYANISNFHFTQNIVLKTFQIYGSSSFLTNFNASHNLILTGVSLDPACVVSNVSFDNNWWGTNDANTRISIPLNSYYVMNLTVGSNPNVGDKFYYTFSLNDGSKGQAGMLPYFVVEVDDKFYQSFIDGRFDKNFTVDFTGNYFIYVIAQNSNISLKINITGNDTVSPNSNVVVVKAGYNKYAIQELIDSANPGDTLLFEGTYYKGISLVINKPLNIVSKSGTLFEGVGNPVFSILSGGSGTNISGFTFNSPGNGINITNGKNIHIFNNTFYSTVCAVYIKNGENILIDNNSFYGNNYGVFVDGSSKDLKIHNNIFMNPTKYGIWIDSDAINLIITKNLIQGGTNAHGIGFGINYLATDDRLDISYNAIFVADRPIDGSMTSLPNLIKVGPNWLGEVSHFCPKTSIDQIKAEIVERAGSVGVFDIYYYYMDGSQKVYVDPNLLPALGFTASLNGANTQSFGFNQTVLDYSSVLSRSLDGSNLKIVFDGGQTLNQAISSSSIRDLVNNIRSNDGWKDSAPKSNNVGGGTSGGSGGSGGGVGTGGTGGSGGNGGTGNNPNNGDTNDDGSGKDKNSDSNGNDGNGNLGSTGKDSQSENSNKASAKVVNVLDYNPKILTKINPYILPGVFIALVALIAFGMYRRKKSSKND